MKLMKFLKDNRSLIIILLIFGIIYSLISLVNHYYFRTYAWDLGIYNHAIYNYLNFKKDNASLLLPFYNINNNLGDHFDILMLLISPLYLIKSSYVLLIFQISSILFGGIGIYMFIKEISNKRIALFGIVHFFSMWGIFSALSFDYHNNVVAAMLVPWFIYYFYIEKWKFASLFFILILLSKENMALWAVFISLGLGMLMYKNKKHLKLSIFLSIIALVYFVLTVKVFIPYFAGNSNEYVHLRFTALGGSLSEILHTIFLHPFYTIKLLFTNHLSDPTYNGIKAELFIVILLSGGIAFFYRPQFLFIILPILGQKLFNDVYARWGLNDHYSIELVPIITIAAFYMIANLKIKYKTTLCFIVTAACLLTTFWKLDNRVSKWYNSVNARFYDKRHYQQNYNIDEVKNALALIPENSSVSAQSMLVPRLAFRDKIYHYPYVGDAQFIVLAPKDDNTYYLTREVYDKQILDYKKSKEWYVYYERSEILIFKKR